MNPLETNSSIENNEKTRPKRRPTLMMTTNRNKATATASSRPKAPKSERESGVPLMTVEQYLHYLVSRK